MLYVLDAVGNRTAETVTVGGTVVSDSTLSYDARNRLTERSDPVAGIHVTQTFDADGNRVSQTINGQGRTFAYDARDRMVTLAPCVKIDVRSFRSTFITRCVI